MIQNIPRSPQQSSSNAILLLNSPQQSTFPLSHALSPKSPMVLPSVFSLNANNPTRERQKIFTNYVPTECQSQGIQPINQQANIQQGTYLNRIPPNSSGDAFQGTVIPMSDFNMRLNQQTNSQENGQIFQSKCNETQSAPCQLIQSKANNEKECFSLSSSFIVSAPTSQIKTITSLYKSPAFDTTPICHQERQSMCLQRDEQQWRQDVDLLLKEEQKQLLTNLSQHTDSVKDAVLKNEIELKKLQDMIGEQERKNVLKQEGELQRRGKVEGDWIQKIDNMVKETELNKQFISQYEETMQNKIEEVIRREVSKSLKERVQSLIARQWEDAEVKMFEGIQAIQERISKYEASHGQTYQDIEEFLKQGKGEIEIALEKGQSQITQSLAAFAENIQLKVNTDDIKAVFVQMNEEFIEKMINQMNELRQQCAGDISEQAQKEAWIQGLEQQIQESVQQLQLSLKQMKDAEQKAQQMNQGFINALERAAQSEKRVNVLEGVIRGMAEDKSSVATRAKIGQLMENLANMKAQFTQLKRSCKDSEKKDQMMSVLNNSSIAEKAQQQYRSQDANCSMNSTTIASFNSQLIQLTQSNKYLTEAVKQKDITINEQKEIISGLQKKLANQSSQLSELLKELKHIKQEFKRKTAFVQVTKQEQEEEQSLMFSSIIDDTQSMHHVLLDSLAHDFKDTMKNSQTCQFDQFADYCEDDDNDEEDEVDSDGNHQNHQRNQQKQLQRNYSKDNKESTQDIEGYFQSAKKKTNSQIATISNSNTAQEDLFFYPRSSEQQLKENQDMITTNTKLHQGQKGIDSISTYQQRSQAKIIPRQSMRKLNNLKKDKIQTADKQDIIRQSIVDRKTSKDEDKQESQIQKYPDGRVSPKREQQQDKQRDVPSNHAITSEETLESLSHLIKRRLLYNNTLAEQKQTKLTCVQEDGCRLKDSLGKYIYNKNGQAIEFTTKQLEYLEKEAQLIELREP